MVHVNHRRRIAAQHRVRDRGVLEHGVWRRVTASEGEEQRARGAAWDDGNDQDMMFAQDAACRAEVARIVRDVLGVHVNSPPPLGSHSRDETRGRDGLGAVISHGAGDVLLFPLRGLVHESHILLRGFLFLVLLLVGTCRVEAFLFQLLQPLIRNTVKQLPSTFFY